MQPILDSEENKYEEEWEVVLQTKAKYTLSKMQATILKQAMSAGKRQVMFETFMIPINYIVEFRLIRRFMKDIYRLPEVAYEQEYIPIPKEKWERIKKNIAEKIGKPMPKPLEKLTDQEFNTKRNEALKRFNPAP